MFVVSGGLFRPTSKRERFQRSTAREAKKQTLALRDQNRLIDEQNRLLDSARNVDTRTASVSSVDSSRDQQMSRIDKLSALGKLHADGILTDEEFAAQKAEILASGV